MRWDSKDMNLTLLQVADNHKSTTKKRGEVNGFFRLRMQHRRNGETESESYEESAYGGGEYCCQ